MLGRVEQPHDERSELVRGAPRKALFGCFEFFSRFHRWHTRLLVNHETQGSQSALWGTPGLRSLPQRWPVVVGAVVPYAIDAAQHPARYAVTQQGSACQADPDSLPSGAADTAQFAGITGFFNSLSSCW